MWSLQSEKKKLESFSLSVREANEEFGGLLFCSLLGSSVVAKTLLHCINIAIDRY